MNGKPEVSRRLMVRRSRVLVLAALGAALALPAAAQADSAYLKLPGPELKGESVDPNFANTIELISYSWDLSRGTDKALFGGFRLKKRVDRSSPGLMLTAAQGRVISSARVNVRGDQKPYLEYCLRDVTVASDRVDHTTAGGPPIETVELRFASLEQRYVQLDDLGQTVATWRTAWNQITQSSLLPAFSKDEVCGS